MSGRVSKEKYVGKVALSVKETVGITIVVKRIERKRSVKVPADGDGKCQKDGPERAEKLPDLIPPLCTPVQPTIDCTCGVVELRERSA